jgi:chromosome segregation ATPase
MKAFVIILGVACVGLAFGYYKRHTGAEHDAEAALKQFQTYSNQVMQLETRLAMANGTASKSQSNLQSTLDRRVAQLAATSNRLVQVGLLLTAAQEERAKAQAVLQSRVAQFAVIDHEHDELQRQIAAIAPLKKQIAELKEKEAKANSDLDFLVLENRRLQVEKNELASKLDDVSFLRLQLAKAEDNAELQRRLARAGQSARVAKSAPLEVLPDGTVRAAIPAKE